MKLNLMMRTKTDTPSLNIFHNKKETEENKQRTKTFDVFPNRNIIPDGKESTDVELFLLKSTKRTSY